MAEDQLRINPAGNPKGTHDIDASQLKVLVGGVVQRLGDVLGEGENPTTLTALANDPATTTGLTYGYKAGVIQAADGAIFNVGAGTTGPLADDNTSTVFWNQDIGVGSTIGTLPVDAISLAQVDTVAGAITSITDKRVFLNTSARFFQPAISDGGFASASGLDLTVSSGGSPLLFNNGKADLDTLTVTLTDDILNYVEFENQSGDSNLVVNITGFTTGNYPVAEVTTADGVVTDLTDKRPFASVPGSWPIGQFIATGGAAGDIVCTGIAVADRLDSVLRFTAGALISVLTSEFTISDANEINNTGGTDTTASTLLVTWSDRTP